jgi:membrane dipeptidase
MRASTAAGATAAGAGFRHAWPMTTTGAEPFLAQARDLLATSPLIDGHNDLPYALRERVGLRIGEVDLRSRVDGLHTDVPRLRDGRVGGQFWSVWVPPDLPEPTALTTALEQIDMVRRLAASYPEALRLAGTATEVEAAFKDGRIASLMGMEGGSMIASSLPVLRQVYAAGIRYLTLTHWKTTRWADAATDAPRHGGLTRFGVEVVREMNRLGMLVDLSHVAPSTMAAALDAAEAPVIFSHSGARAVADHPRNVPDEILRRLPGNGGVVMAVFLSGFVSADAGQHFQEQTAREEEWRAEHPEAAADEVRAWRHGWIADHPAPPATLAQVADHIDHLCRVAGVEHVGIGSDFDGGDALPVGLDDVSRFPWLIAELLRRGYREDDVRQIAGGNVLRVMRGAEAAAARLQAQRPPSDATIEELDGPDT